MTPVSSDQPLASRLVLSSETELLAPVPRGGRMDNALRRPEGRCAASTMLAAVTSGLSVVREPRLVRERFEQQLRTLVRARSVLFRDDDEATASGPDTVSVPIANGPSSRGARIEATFDPGRPPDAWARRMLGAAGQVAGLLLEIERANGRWPLACATSRVDGAAPLIGSSAAIRAVRERLEKVAATDFTVLTREHHAHSRTLISLRFSVSLPSTTATGRWRERGRIR
jgi:hypothetical protein